ncbi:flavin-dependent oxidoreductase [Amycolatopsis sp. FDAARGOS 1241]|uniref:flavin-dependent oxidoreductase n=1 Tax=Amycolatopsis sp. FDAARGOS 1241 TaxID=2778070 RepID=UPI00194FC6D1|nr:flavin-dependent oxidoreductase [Amycolatopsis sp. FDAARGOS 1241]QRP50296.1 flavin-dependent oxidoreductase [Amycolatopsis sp. FDAARGOS 1241]
MKVVIVGAGIGGLTTALRLHHAGIECVVHEQSERIAELGVGINALPHAVKELAAIGLLDSLDEIGIRTRELFYTHRLGQVILRKPCGVDAGFTLPQFCLHRGRLQGLLLRAVRERLGPGAVRTGHRLTGFDQDASGVRAQFADRRGGTEVTVHGDVLVAADGIHSTVRSRLFPAEGPPRWNGVLMWRGATDWPEFGGGRSMIVAGGTAAKLVIYPIAQGRRADTRLTNWAICIQTGQPGAAPPERQDWAKPGDRAELARHVGRFSSAVVDHAGLVEATEEIFEFPMCDRDPLPAWSHGRVTLLGDAAHPMYPMGSNGAGQAILDATSLAGHLARHADPAGALRAYEDDRLAATSEVVLRNRRGGPENVIDEVERRAPDGFSRLEDVIDAAALEAIVTGYAQVTGASQQQVNAPGR